MNKKPLVSIVIAAYNEEAIIEKNLSIIYQYMKTLENVYNWEIIVVNDGSSDNTGNIADELAKKIENIKIIHHTSNKNLGTAIRSGFEHCQGKYIITLDLDLSYSIEHIKLLINEIEKTNADIVLTSPYMKGGKVTKVPFLRKYLSRTLNKFLQFIVHQNIHTFTSMVRAYKGSYLKILSIKSILFDINTEIIYKSIILNANIVEIPAHLDWSEQLEDGKTGISHIKMYRGILTGFLSCFIFRPHMLFITIGFILAVISLYIISWIFYNVIVVYPDMSQTFGYFDDKFSDAVAEVFKRRPHAFFVAGITSILSIQFISMGFLSFQNKRNFEDSFHLNTSIYKYLRKINSDL